MSFSFILVYKIKAYGYNVLIVIYDPLIYPFNSKVKYKAFHVYLKSDIHIMWEKYPIFLE